VHFGGLWALLILLIESCQQGIGKDKWSWMYNQIVIYLKFSSSVFPDVLPVFKNKLTSKGYSESEEEMIFNIKSKSTIYKFI
jgi:hypothetical protein